MYKKRGFTLIEILAVVTILAIAAVAAIPMMSNGYADVKLTAAGRAVMADLFYAQNYAITTQNNVYVVFVAASSSIGGSYRLQTVPTGNAPISRPAGGTFVVNLGRVSGAVVGSTLADAKLSTVPVTVGGTALASRTIGFDTLGEPVTYDGTTTTPAAGPTTVPLLSPDGRITMTLSIEPFTGEITVQ